DAPRSRAAARRRADAHPLRARGNGAAALHGCSGGDVRGARHAAGGPWHLRRARVQRRSAGPRDRDPDGARRTFLSRPVDGRSAAVGQALRLGGIGIAIGLAGALALTRVLASLLFGVGASDPLTFAAVCVMSMIVVASAAWLPARRATRVDPLVALRAD